MPMQAKLVISLFRSHYIPVIAWGRNARFAKMLNAGDNIRTWGRMQSRNYQKRISDTETIMKIAYKMSVNRLQLVEHGTVHAEPKNEDVED